jgi:hypothetical protein
MTIKHLWDQEHGIRNMGSGTWDQEHLGSSITRSSDAEINKHPTHRLDANSNSFEQSRVDSEAPTFQIGKVQMNKMNKLTV